MTCYGFRKRLEILINFKVKNIEYLIVVFKNLLLSRQQINDTRVVFMAAIWIPWKAATD